MASTDLSFSLSSLWGPRSSTVGGEDAELESTGEDLLEPGAFEETVEEHDKGLLVVTKGSGRGTSST